MKRIAGALCAVLSSSVLSALAVMSAASASADTDYYMIGSDGGSNCALDGNGSPKGWALAADSATQESPSATDPNGIYHLNGRNGNKIDNNSEPGVLRGALANTGANYNFAGKQFVFDGFCPAMQVRQDTNKTITFDNVLVVSGVNGEFRNGRGGTTPVVAGSNWVVEAGATLGLSTCENKRDITCTATVTGRGKLAAVGGLDEYRGYKATGNGKGTARNVTFYGDLSAFEGIFSAGERSNCDIYYGTYTHADCVNGLKCIIAASAAFPQATPDGDLLERSIVVTNGATLSFTCDVTSPAMRGWDFGAAGTQPTIDIASGKTVTIFGPVKGAIGFKKTGAGTLVLNVGGNGDYDTITLTGSQTLSTADLSAYVAKCDEWINDISIFGVNVPTLAAADCNSLAISTRVNGLSGAETATVKFITGLSPDALTMTNAASSSATAASALVQGAFTRLTPGVGYYVKAVAEKGGETVESAVIRIETSPDPAPRKHLPVGYTYFDYITANGQQYINTGLFPSDALSVKATIATTDTTVDKMVFGVRDFGYKFVAWLGTGATGLTPNLGNGSPSSSSGIVSLGEKWTLTFGVDGIYKNDTELNSAGLLASYKNGAVSSMPLLLFGLQNNPSIDTRKFVGDCYGFQAYENGILVRNMIPAQRDSDGAVGMLDILDGTFYENLGTGAFASGPVFTPFTADANIANGELSSVSLSFGASSSARTLKVAIGPTYGGDDPASWAATETVATVAADATSATWTPPADWGSDQKLVARFYFEGATPEWSNDIFWRDYSAPVLSGITLDGTGGDTLIVSGRLESFSGDSCTLTILTGGTSTTVTNVWTGATRTSTGDFTFTLHESDTTAARYIAPGMVAYAVVVATANGQTTHSGTASTVMKGAPVFPAQPSASVSRRTVTFSGILKDCGMGGSAVVTLYTGAASAGENALVATGEPVIVTDTTSFSFAHTFPAFDTSYKWQLRAVATSASGETTRETRTAVAAVTTKDATTYTWTGAGSDNKWSNQDNWSDNKGGDCFGYPQSADATARFRMSATVDIDIKKTIGSLDLAIADADITFTSASTTSFQLTLNGITAPLEGTTWTIDGAYVYRNGELKPVKESCIYTKNGGYLYLGNVTMENNATDATIICGDGGTNSFNYFRVGAGGSCVISNGYMQIRDGLRIGYSTTGGSLVFKGKHPLLYSSSNSGVISAELASSGTILGLEVPEGGYDAPVILSTTGKNVQFFNDSKSSGITIKILESSPAFHGASTTTSPLVKWYKGYTTANMTYAPIPSAGSAFAIENTTDLNVTINPYTPVTDKLTVVSAFGTPSPAVGDHTGYTTGSEYSLSSGGTVTSGGVRHVCTGYRLHSIDSLTGERTLLASGAEDAIAYTFPGGWVEVEWLWKTENATAAGASEHGTVQISGEWADEYGYATATAVADAGWRFSYWSGDITDVQILQNPAKVPGNRPRTLVANFVPDDTEVFDNTYTGAKDGSWNTDGNWSLGHVPTAEENAIIPTGKGTVKITNAGKCASLKIVNDVSLQLLGSGTVADDQIRLDVRGSVQATCNNVTIGSELSIYNAMFNVGGDLCISNNSRTVNLTIYAGDYYGTNSNAIIREGYMGMARLGEYFRGGAQVNVGGALILGGTHLSNKSNIYIWSHGKTGMSPVFRVGRFVQEKCGVVTCDGRWGWRSYGAAFYHGIGSASKDGGGASYGGIGGIAVEGNTHAPGPAYGYEAAPIWPGSAGARGHNDGGHGGSLFRLHATGDVMIDGTVNMNGCSWGSNTTRGGGSGGGVWITCASFDAGANASITAKGGNHSYSSSAAGGGGRVAVAAGGVSDADIASFFKTGVCDGYVMNDFSETAWPTLVNVDGGVCTHDTHNDWNNGSAGTAKYLQNALGKSILVVKGSPFDYGEALPDYLTHVVDTGDVACEVGGYAYVPGMSNGSRYLADGYVWTNSVTTGSGSGTSVTVPVIGDTTLVWLWRDLEHNLVTTSGGHGSVSAHNDWYADGASVTLTATPEAGAVFVRWTGDIDTADASSATVTFTMTSPRRLVAVFDVPGAAARSLTYSGGDWFDPATWDGVAIPGTNDSVTVSASVSPFTFGATVDVGNLAITGGTFSMAPTQGAYNSEVASEYGTPLTLNVAGDLAISNSAVVNVGVLDGDVRTDINVDGDMTVSGTATINAYASVGELDDSLRTWRHYKAGGLAFNVGGDLVFDGSAKALTHTHRMSGVGVVWNVAGDVTIGASAQISGTKFTAYNNVEAYGWAARGGPYYRDAAGSYGGNGGNISGDNTYGFAYAPFYPGTAAPQNKSEPLKAMGGGSVRIAAGGTVTLNGKIYVTGGNGNGNTGSCGAGGGVWITCASFEAGSSALIHARGGEATQHSSCPAGGGGRVAIITGSPTEEQIDSLYATGSAENIIFAADLTDAVASPWPTLVNIEGGLNSDRQSDSTYSTHGKPGTAVYLQNSAGKAVITIGGDQTTTETVPQYGQATVDMGERTFTAPAFIYLNDGCSRYPCVGYEWEDSAGNTGSGGTSSFTLDVQRDLSVTWLWGTLEHFLDVRHGGLCTVSYAAQGSNALGWYDEGTVVRVSCAPEAASTTFHEWVGDVPYAAKGNTAVDITVDAPKVIVATLHRDSARARSLVWTGNGDGLDWFDKDNWDGVGIPGKFDSVLVTNGTFQIMFPSEMELASFAVSNAACGFVGCEAEVFTFTGSSGGVKIEYTRAMSDAYTRPYSFAVSGDFSLGGTARLYFGGIDQGGRMDVSVGRNMTLSGGTSSARPRIHLCAGNMGDWTSLDNYRVGGGSLTVGGAFSLEGYAQFTPVADRRSGAIVPIRAATVSVGPNALINANYRGFGRSYRNPGTGWVRTVHGYATTGSSIKCGGSYGGQGGYNYTESFGYLAAPFYPGGSGSTENGTTTEIFSGGGAVRIVASRITLEGKILANGYGGYAIGSGSGGGVWLTCDKFALGDNGAIEARHDNGCGYGGTGGGGGGRIAVGLRLNAGQIEKLYRRGEVRGMTVTPFESVTDGTALAEKIGNAWTGRYNVAGGTAPGDGLPGTAGTAVMVEAPAEGTVFMMR